MARVFVSFVGKGPYSVATYSWSWGGEARKASPTEYAQRAELELLGAVSFDRVVLLVTATSRGLHEAPLRAQLESLGVAPDRIQFTDISENLADLSQQWRWFEALLAAVNDEDRLVVDMTHGFRAVPIVLSSAIGYLRRVKRVEIEHVLYGALDAGGVIVDMRDFYVVQDFAEAVGRLVDTADARLLAELADQASPESTFSRLGATTLVDALNTLTDVLRNVDVHRIADATETALRVVGDAAKAGDASHAEKQLLGLVASKFAALVSSTPASHRYDGPYLKVQIEVADKLLEHGLLMQGFTVLRELIGSIGMYGLGGTKYDKGFTKDKERSHAGVFVNMLQYDRNTWAFSGDAERLKEHLEPWYERLASGASAARTETPAETVASRLHSITKRLVEIRNGYDHAWTGNKTIAKVAGTGTDAFERLKQEGRAQVVELRSLIAVLPAPPGQEC